MSIGSHNMSGREKEGKKERMKIICNSSCLLSMEPWAVTRRALS
jgi:hypothetical protein